MTRIKLDSATAAKLQKFKQPVELCDVSGRTFGEFVPRRGQARYAKVKIPITEEELKRREKNLGRGRSLAKIIADLEKRK